MANTANQSTTADQFLIDTWARKVEQTRTRDLIFRNLFTPASAYGAPPRGFQNMFITRTTALNSGTARTKTEGNDNTITYDVNTDTAITLTIDQWKYQALEVEDFAQALTDFNIAELYLREIGEVIARDEDAYYAGLVDGASQSVGGLGVENTEAEFLEAVQKLDDNDVPKDGRAWGLSPKAHSRLLAQQKFTSIDYVDSKGVSSGKIPALYSYPVFVSPGVEGTNAAGHDNVLTRKSAATFHRVGDYPKMRKVMSEDNFSEKAALSNIYGAVEVRDLDMVWIKGA